MTLSRSSLVALLFMALATPALAGGDASAGAKVFARCAGCHTTDGTAKAGPSLAGIMGRKAGTIPGFRYSKALPASGLVWDEATLDNFLAAPMKTVPGTYMVLAVPSAKERTDLIAYLKSLNPPKAP